MGMVDRLRGWTRRRLRLELPAAGPLDALREVLAVYSAHPSGPLSLVSRASPFGPRQFGDMERSRAALRVAGMRGSAFLVPAEAAGKIVTATRWPTGQLLTHLRAQGLEAATYERLKPRVLEAMREPVSPAELKRAVDGDDTAVMTMRGMAREGLVLRVGWGDRVRSDSLRWVAADAWLGRPLADPDTGPERALGWLAGEYFRVFGPARVEDLAWWIGISRAAAREQVQKLDLAALEDGLLLPSELADAFQAIEPCDPDVMDVLPKWDPYTMAYAPDGRQRLVSAEHLPFAYSTLGSNVGATTGDGLPLILRGGRAIASWQHKLAGPRMTISVRTFPGELPPDRASLESAFAPIVRLMDAEIVLDHA